MRGFWRNGATMANLTINGVTLYIRKSDILKKRLQNFATHLTLEGVPCEVCKEDLRKSGVLWNYNDREMGLDCGSCGMGWTATNVR